MSDYQKIIKEMLYVFEMIYALKWFVLKFLNTYWPIIIKLIRSLWTTSLSWLTLVSWIGPSLTVGVWHLSSSHFSSVSIWWHDGSVSEMEVLIHWIIVWISPFVAWFMIVHTGVISTPGWGTFIITMWFSWPVFSKSWGFGGGETFSWVGWWRWGSWGSSWWCSDLNEMNSWFIFLLDNEFIEDVLGIPFGLSLDGNSGYCTNEG